jgi:hypothetical protein
MSCLTVWNLPTALFFSFSFFQGAREGGQREDSCSLPCLMLPVKGGAVMAPKLVVRGRLGDR